MRPSRGTELSRRVAPYLPGLRRTALLAVLCNLALELAGILAGHGYPWRFKTPAFALLFLLGTVVIWLVVGLVHAVVGRLWLTAVLMGVLTVLAAVADFEKIRLRREPLYPSDLRFAGDVGFLAHVVGPRTVLLALVLTLAVGASAVLVARRYRSAAAPPGLRLLTAGVCLLGLGYLTGFNAPDNVARRAYDALGARWRPWSQQQNYLGNGFVAGTLYNLDVPEMPRPAGYSKAEMGRIVARYTAAAERINRSRDPHGLDRANVVLVLSESFSDPEALTGVHLTEDPIPFTRRLLGETTSGRMLAQGIGGGTANMEFEALTGMSLALLPPQVRVPYQMLVPGHASFPSAVEWMRGTGHRAVAIHPYTTEMYRRRDVYPTLGFDRFVHGSDMHDQRRSGRRGYISDAAAFDEVTRQLTASREPLFVHLVTMQNHVPYNGRYDVPVPVTGPDGETLTLTGQYLRGLTYSDRALAGLLDRLRRLDEPTVLVFYGDHLPGTYPDSVYAANGPRRMHETPFFVWANTPGPRRPQPLTSPTHFMDLALERLDAPVPPYYALLQRLREQVPAMDGGMMFDAAGRPVRPGRPGPRAARLLHDYRMVQYDLAAGHRWSEQAMLAPAAPPPPTR